MTRVLAIASQKGGAGKTTTVANLGASLAAIQKRVLLIDLDPQATLSTGVGVDSAGLKETVYTALTVPGFSVSRIIYPVKAYLDMIPANIDLASAEVELVAEIQRERYLLRALDPVLAWYDYVLIDCPPNLGLLTMNALVAGQQVLIPAPCEPYALRSMNLLVEAIQLVQQRLNPKLVLTGILPVRYDAKSDMARNALQEMKNTYGNKVLDIVIDDNPKFVEALVDGQALVDIEADSPGAGSYQELAALIASFG